MPASVGTTMSALTLFPGWEDIGPWYRAEVQGLTEAQLDFAAPAPAPEWLWWSIRRHTSHTARVLFLWLFSIWGDTLWEGHPPPVHDLSGLLNFPPKGQPSTSQLNPHTYWAIDTILTQLDEGIACTQEALRRHTVAQAQQKKTTLAPRAGVNMSQLQQAHPHGFEPFLADPTRWIFTLEGTVRHLYFEAITHLYTQNRHPDS